MREILFKAKQINNGEWVQGYYTHVPYLSKHYIVHETKIQCGINAWQTMNSCEINPETLCQYTGLTDKNGKKIWENDVVKYHFGEDTAVIRFGKYQSCFDSQKCCHVGFYVDWQDYKRKDLGYWVQMIDCNVIGNIFDNPELLKGGASNE